MAKCANIGSDVRATMHHKAAKTNNKADNLCRRLQYRETSKTARRRAGSHKPLWILTVDGWERWAILWKHLIMSAAHLALIRRRQGPDLPAESLALLHDVCSRRPNGCAIRPTHSLDIIWLWP